MRGVRKIIALLCLLVTCLCFTGCKKEEQKIEKLRDIEFTVVKDGELPTELLEQIEAKKEKPFKFTYMTVKKDYLYIVVGYGKQPTGGYSITVDDLYLTNNSIYIDTNLLGPSKDDVVTQAITYPYVVVKIEYIEKPVTFT